MLTDGSFSSFSSILPSSGVVCTFIARVFETVVGDVRGQWISFQPVALRSTIISHFPCMNFLHLSSAPAIMAPPRRIIPNNTLRVREDHFSFLACHINFFRLFSSSSLRFLQWELFLNTSYKNVTRSV